MTEFARLLVVTLLLPLGGADSGKDVPGGYAAWGYPVFVSDRADSGMRKVASRLAAALGEPNPIVARVNPGCAFWVEVDGWKPNPGEDGYVAVIQPGGAYVRASNDAQLLEAIRNIEKTIIKKDGKVFLPTGILTSYRLIGRPE